MFFLMRRCVGRCSRATPTMMAMAPRTFSDTRRRATSSHACMRMGKQSHRAFQFNGELRREVISPNHENAITSVFSGCCKKTECLLLAAQRLDIALLRCPESPVRRSRCERNLFRSCVCWRLFTCGVTRRSSGKNIVEERSCNSVGIESGIKPCCWEASLVM